MSKGWDNATLKKLKALTGKGLSTSEIGRRLGMSKNAVVGKLNRLGWNSKAGGGEASVSGQPATKKATAKPATGAKKTAPKSIATKPAAVKTTKKVVATTASKATSKKMSAPDKKTPAVTTTKKTTTKATTTAKGEKSLTKNLAMHQRIIQHSLEMANLKPNQCRWPIGDPDSENFHFCGETVFVGKPYCYEHCRQAYQFTQKK